MQKPTRPTRGKATAPGRSARAARPATRQRSETSRNWLSGMRGDVYTVTTFVMIVFGILTLSPSLQIWFQQRQEIADYSIQVQRAKDAVARMKVERQRWDDPVYIRSQARSRLYYVLPGEVSFLVMDSNGVNLSDTSGTVGAALAAQQRNTEVGKGITETKRNWVDNVLESVVRSGLEQPVSKKAASN
jgi:cell division protein FtsB